MTPDTGQLTSVILQMGPGSFLYNYVSRLYPIFIIHCISNIFMETVGLLATVYCITKLDNHYRISAGVAKLLNF
jgi:hypothetical protein